jgi:hypothetical protein
MFVCNRYDIVFNIITFSDNIDTLPRIPRICLCTIYKRHWLGVMHGLSQKDVNNYNCNYTINNIKIVVLYRMTLYYNIGMNYCMYIKQIRDVVHKTQSKAI